MPLSLLGLFRHPLALFGALLLLLSSPLRAEPGIVALSDSIDQFDLQIRRAPTDSIRNALFEAQAELMVQVDSLRAELLTQRDSQLLAAEAAAATAAKEKTPSLRDLLLRNLLLVTFSVLLLCSSSFLLLRMLFKGGSKKEASHQPPLQNSPRRKKREKKSRGEKEFQQLDLSSPSAVGQLRTEELRIESPLPKPKVPRNKRSAVPSTITPLSTQEIDLLDKSPRSARPSQTAPSSAAENLASSLEAPSPEPALDSEPRPLFLSPSALTRLEEEDRTRADILKLTRRGYTGSEIARRMRLPQEQVDLIIRNTQLRGE